MHLIHRVLFPIDLSLNYRTLSAITRRTFDHRNVEVILLHAVEEAPRSVRGVEMDRAMAQLEFVARREFEVAQIRRCVERGRAVDRILAHARDRAVEAILMPAGASEDLRRGSLGHVTEEILSRATCAVWMDRMVDRAAPLRRICCALRLDETDRAVLSQAVGIAERCGAELTIIHVVAPESPMMLWWDRDAFEYEIKIARVRVEELRDRFAPQAQVHVEAGRIDSVISQSLCRLGADLLVVTGQRETIAAAAVACPVMRIAASLPEQGDDALAATA